MALRVALLNGCDNNYDYDLTLLLGALIQGHGVVSGLAVTSGQVGTGYGFILVTRTGGYTFPVLVHNTANYVVDTTGTKKVWIALDQADIDDNGLNINSAQDNVATIATGASYPVTPHLKLASITGGVITDERETIQLTQGVNRLGTLAETIGGVKTFSSFPITPSSAPTTDYQVANRKYVIDTIASSGINITGLTEQTSLAVGDMFPLYDVSGAVNMKATLANMINQGYVMDIVSLTKSTADASGSVAVSHNLGRLPKMAWVYMIPQNYGTYDVNSWGWRTPSEQGGINKGYNSSAVKSGQMGSNVLRCELHATTSVNTFDGSLGSPTTTQMTMTWTKTGTPITVTMEIWILFVG